MNRAEGTNSVSCLVIGGNFFAQMKKLRLSTELFVAVLCLAEKLRRRILTDNFECALVNYPSAVRADV